MLEPEPQHRQRAGLENLPPISIEKSLKSGAVLDWLCHVARNRGGRGGV